MVVPDPSADIVVIGAGALGLATAAELALRGRSVTVIDPGAGNASTIAAGMIAPASEAYVEWRDSRGEVDRIQLYLRARDRFADLADRAGLDVSREGCLWSGSDASDVAAAWQAWGVLAGVDPVPLTDADWRIEPATALRTLARRERLTMLEGQVVGLSEGADGWNIALKDGGALRASHVVIATGTQGLETCPAILMTVLGQILPIRGQLGWLGRCLVDRMVRADGVYLAPSAGGMVIGATMQPGHDEPVLDHAAGEQLLARARALLNDPLEDPIQWRVGIRGSSPDGLPMAGTLLPGLHTALAPRRNGWLMSGLVASLVADEIEDRVPGPDAATLNPLRF